jgi:hypothetical protein
MSRKEPTSQQRKLVLYPTSPPQPPSSTKDIASPIATRQGDIIQTEDNYESESDADFYNDLRYYTLSHYGRGSMQVASFITFKEWSDFIGLTIEDDEIMCY